MTDIYDDLVAELGIDPAEEWQPHLLPEFATHVIVPEQPMLTLEVVPDPPEEVPSG